MAHPYLFLRALVPNAMEQVAIIDDINEGAPELSMVG